MKGYIVGRRIMIIGCGGSGKSTLAKSLYEKIRLPLVHLDSVFWQSGWVETPPEEWLEKLKGLVAKDEWIIDGNFNGSMDMRLDAADTVIFLDFGSRICYRRIKKRVKMYAGKTRSDMAEGCPERKDDEFFEWVRNYNKTSRHKVLEKLERHPDIKQIILRKPKDVKKFLNTVVLKEF